MLCGPVPAPDHRRGPGDRPRRSRGRGADRSYCERPPSWSVRAGCSSSLPCKLNPGTIHVRCKSVNRMGRMTPQRPRRADRRTPLTRERVLDAAIALTDERGIEALTMRSLGEALGVEAMSLYNHVANKDDLLDH